MTNIILIVVVCKIIGVVGGVIGAKLGLTALRVATVCGILGGGVSLLIILA